jgi:hypothetical protein
MNATKVTLRNTLAIGLLCIGLLGATPALAGSPGNTDEARSWAALQRMKPMEVMHAIDADKKAYVTREEFMKFQEELFARMDRNADGKVDAKEWMGK